MSKSIVRRIIVISLIILLMIALSLVSLFLVTGFHMFPQSNDAVFKKKGSQWVSEDESISFTVFREMWYRSDDDETTKIEAQRYFGFGKMELNNELIDISCLCDVHEIRIYQFGYDVNYADESPEIDIRLSVNAVSETEVITTVRHIFSGQDYFRVGQEIRFTQINDPPDLDNGKYEFYVDYIQFITAYANNTEVDIYETLDDLKLAKANTE